LVLGTSIQRWELEQSLLDGSIVVDVNGVFEHVIDEIRVRLYEIIEGRQNLQVLSLLFVEQVESDLVLI
jgi:hypothetical protein